VKSLLVTGGAGFIGSNYVRFVLGRTDARVLVVDKLTYSGNLGSLADVSEDPRFTFVEGDIGDRATMGALLSAHSVSHVVNFAAETHVDRSIDDAGAFIETNVTGTFQLLEAARHYWRTLTPAQQGAFRFLHVSTDEVYGTLGATGVFSEETPYAPNSPYAASKAAADHLVRAWRETYGLPTLITNCSNNYGPYQFPEKLIPLMILTALEGKPLPIYGDGGNVRDWLYVDDHCSGIHVALEKGAPGQKYNIGGGNERRNIEVVDRICDVLDRERPPAKNPALASKRVHRYRELKTFVKDRPGHDRRYAIDAAKIRRELGWKPEHAFEDGIASTVRWYLDHAAWCEAVQSGTYRCERLGLAPDGGPR
jgi:dTDP-glucose 4,6-dehydratase